MTKFALPKPSRLDRVIEAVSPSWARKRMGDRVALAGYHALVGAGRGGFTGADKSRRAMKNWRASDGSADTALLPDLEQLRTNSSDLVRNFPLATGALDTIATKIIGTGLKLQARPDRKFLGLGDEQAQEWEAQAERLWAHWCKRCDYDKRIDNFASVEFLVQHSMLEFGDIFAVKVDEARPGDLFSLKVQLFEGGRVCNPDRALDSDRIAAGVQTDAQGRPEGIWVADRHPNDVMARGAHKTAWKFLPMYGKDMGRKQVLHIMWSKRVGQSRGMPLLAPVIETLKQMSKLTEAELMAAVVTSCYAIVSKTQGGGGAPTLGETAAASNSLQRAGITFETGMIAEGLMPNEEIMGFAPNRPNSAFDPFMLAMTRQIAVALGLSHEVLIRHFTASYSASRAALLEVWEFVRRQRSWIAQVLHQELYEEVIWESVARGYLKCAGWEDPIKRDAWCKARWVGPSPGQLNPVHEVNAAKMKVDAGFSTIEEQTVEICGGDFDANMVQRKREIAVMREIGADVETTAERIVTEPKEPVPAEPTQEPPPDKPEDETQDE